MKNVDLTRIHYLSGPFEIETAEPGDVLLVEISTCLFPYNFAISCVDV